MEYFLTEMECIITYGVERSFQNTFKKITQLVKATDKDLARKAVEDAAKSEHGSNITIVKINVNDTLISNE